MAQWQQPDVEHVPVPSVNQPLRALLVSHRGARCGVYQFGQRLFTALTSGGGIAWQYSECETYEEFIAAEDDQRPDLVLLNYHPATLGWADKADFDRCRATIFSVFHEAHQTAADRLTADRFHHMLCPDPTLLARNPIAVPVPRFIPDLAADPGPPPEIFTVGSFGFATPGKGFERLCELVDAQLDIARIRINIPTHDLTTMVPRERLDAIITGCQSRITKPGIRLEITHDFFSETDLLAFLAQNTINAFLYENGNERGISSCTDYALACSRPIAISRSLMFRHLHNLNPSICVEDRDLAAIAATGADILRAHREAYRAPTSGAAWNRAMVHALEMRAKSRGVPDRRGFNKILDDRSRGAYEVAQMDLRRLAPGMLARKIPRANIQQAFALDAVERFAADQTELRMLAIGSFEDTAVAALHAKGYRLDEVDPNVNGLDLAAFYRLPDAILQSYGLILCVSVLEHVEDDSAFMRMVADLLAPGGIAIFTVDFSDRYPVDGRKPAVDRRLYTIADLRERLMAVMPDCGLVDTPTWTDGDLDFEYEGCSYAFASWVFRKLHVDPRHQSTVAFAGREPYWKQQLQSQDLVKEQLTADLAALTDQSARLRTLVREMRWPGGPRALRLVLPLARLLRWFARTPIPMSPSEGADPAGLPSAPPEPHARPRAGYRRLAGAFFRPIYRRMRPAVRRLAWRLLSAIPAEAQADFIRFADHLRLTAPDPSGRSLFDALPPTGNDPVLAEVQRLGRMLETTLLTLALERPPDER